jgi:general secretion pathway protein A
MRQLRQRIPGICRISLLNRDEVVFYIKYRLEVAGSNNGGPYFTEDSFDEIYHFTNGTPRLINILCDRVLLIGYVSNTRTIDGKVVREGIRELDNKDAPLGDRRIKPV